MKKITFKLIYQDGEDFAKKEFEVEDIYDIIELADTKLEQEVWASAWEKRNSDMEMRKWKRLDSTTYRALYNIPKEVMEARYNHCVDVIENYLASLKQEKAEDQTTEDFFAE